MFKYIIKEVVSTLFPYWKKGLLPIFYLFFSTIITFIYPLFSKWAFDELVYRENREILSRIIFSFLFLIVLQKLISYFSEVGFFKFQKNTMLSLQKRILKKLFNYPMNFFDSNHSGYLTGRIRGDIAGLSFLFSDNLIMLLFDTIKVIVIFIILININTKLALLCLSIVPLMIITFRFNQNKIEKINQHIIDMNAEVEKELSDTFQGIVEYKCFAVEESGMNRAYWALKEYQQTEINKNTLLSRYRNTLSFCSHIGEVILLYFGINEISQNRLSFGDYIAFTGYLVILYQTLKNFSYSNVFFDYAKQSYRKLHQVLNLELENSGLITFSRINEVEVNQLYFNYNNHDVLSNVSFKLKKGDKMQILGPSGCGKTTLLKLLIGFYRPSKGKILFNGQALFSCDLKNLRQKVGYVPQNVFLFNLSIRENLIFSNDHSRDNEIYDILGRCNLLKLINELDMGLDYIINENGKNFSGGEKQRIAIARALLHRPDILILDEATSNIDSINAKNIEKYIIKSFSDRILINVTHKTVDTSCWKILNIY